jgi:hypothetical protein
MKELDKIGRDTAKKNRIKRKESQIEKIKSVVHNMEIVEVVDQKIVVATQFSELIEIVTLKNIKSNLSSTCMVKIRTGPSYEHRYAIIEMFSPGGWVTLYSLPSQLMATDPNAGHGKVKATLNDFAVDRLELVNLASKILING